MCLLIQHPATTEFTYEDIEDFFTYNSDGLGIMYAEDNKLYIPKTLPKTAMEAYQFYMQYAYGRNCAIHFRMKTHGLIDLENCHPYEVFGDGSNHVIYLMHNGVLHTGNSADVTKSDTWHYIRDYLRPILSADPTLFAHNALIEMMEDHIGSGNKFVMMDHTGKMSVVNERAFVEYKGALLSNTYAWTASRGGYGYKNNYKSYGNWLGSKDYDDLDDYWTSKSGTGSTGGAVVTQSKTMNDNDLDEALDFFQLLEDMGYRDAYQELTYVQVNMCIDDCGEELFEEFIGLIVQGACTDAEIISAVTNIDYLLELLYGNPSTYDAVQEQFNQGGE